MYAAAGEAACEGRGGRVMDDPMQHVDKYTPAFLMHCNVIGIRVTDSGVEISFVYGWFVFICVLSSSNIGLGQEQSGRC